MQVVYSAIHLGLRGEVASFRDKGYDSDAIRPNESKNCFSPVLYRQRNAIERMFGRVKDFRRIATRYDRLAQNFLAAVCLAAIVCYWL